MNQQAKNSLGYGSIINNDNELEGITISTIDPSTKDEAASNHKQNYGMGMLPRLFSWNHISFDWLHPLIKFGHEKQFLDPIDLELIPLPSSLMTINAMERFNEYWELEMNKAECQHLKTNNKENGGDDTHKSNITAPSLPLCLYRSFGKEFIIAGIPFLMFTFLLFIGPIVLNLIIKYLSSPTPSLSYGLVLVLLVTVSQVILSLCLRHHLHMIKSLGLRVRSVVATAIYHKSLILCSGERQTKYSSPGKIINLMAADCDILQDVGEYLHFVWQGSLHIVLAMYFLWRLLGTSCLGGMVVLIVMMPVTKKISEHMSILQTDLMAAKDERIGVNNEVLGSMKVVKIQAWEDSFRAQILRLRNTELKKMFHYQMFGVATHIIWIASPLLVGLMTFTLYVWLGNELDVATALTTLALLEMIQFPLTVLPIVINLMVEANVSVKRITSFLLSEEYEGVEQGSLKDIGVRISNASFVYDSKKQSNAGMEEYNGNTQKIIDLKWELSLVQSQLANAEFYIEEMEKKDNMNNGVSSDVMDLLSLKRINFECKRGDFVVIVGAVGAGKTTLINSILGEVRKVSGDVSVCGRVGYFAQTPFIMNDTVRSNILFTSNYNDKNIDMGKYEQVLTCCALKTDIKSLPNRDMTSIGEKGITLSGGQKSRVAMARIAYHNEADIYLLDDPLAAVDAHVGNYMFQKCIIEKLLLGGIENRTRKFEKSKERNATVIMVTNALQYLSNSHVDKIVVMKDGRIAEMGSYASLMKNKNSLFQSLVQSFQKSLNVNASYSTTEEKKCVKEEDDRDLAYVTTSLLESAPQIPQKSLSAVPEMSNMSSPLSTQISDESSLLSYSFVNEDEKILDEDRLQRQRQSSLTRISVRDLESSKNEEREQGQVDCKVYLSWFKAAGSIWSGVLIIILFGFIQTTEIISRWWLTYWGQNAASIDGVKGQMWYLMVYAAINFTTIIASFVKVLILKLCGLKASKKLFSRMLSVILHAPMSFFDTTPIGRIVNRFSKDIFTLDDHLSDSIDGYLHHVTSIISIVGIIITVTPSIIFIIVPLAYFYIKQLNYFITTYRELKRIDATSRSPIYELLGETLDGISTLRAFGRQSSLMARFRQLLDEQQHVYYLNYSAQCWMAVRLELVGALIVSFACLCTVLKKWIMSLYGNDSENDDDTSFAAIAGLSISFALQITSSLNESIHSASSLEANMVSVERIQNYCHTENELSKRTTAVDKTIGGRWPPSKGIIEFQNAKLRYRPGLPLVLKGLTLTIPSRSKVGVVGRTGAGKSTLMTALLRLVELDSGTILIDGVDISTIGLEKLRSYVAVIPQDPVLFTGTVKSNLDPFEKYTEDELYAALARVGLTTSTSTKSAAITSLDDSVLANGSNFSVGQRQLLVIAQGALLGKASIIIMDEATAAMDNDTDARIQHVIRSELSHATCITVAHRINTIMDCDYILSMDDGQAVEFDKPDVLLKRAGGGIFKDLVGAWEEEKKGK